MQHPVARNRSVPRVVRSFSFSNVHTLLARQAASAAEQRPSALTADEILFADDCCMEVSAISNPSLSVCSSDLDDACGDNVFDAFAADEDDGDGSAIVVLPSSRAATSSKQVAADFAQQQSSTATVGGKKPSSTTLRHRIKRKFLKLSLNELWRGGGRRGSKKHQHGGAPLVGGVEPAAMANAQETVMNALPSPLVSELERRRETQLEEGSGLSQSDIERQQGHMVSRYERNLLIFNWLHDLEEQWVTASRQVTDGGGSGGGTEQQPSGGGGTATRLHDAAEKK